MEKIFVKPGIRYLVKVNFLSSKQLFRVDLLTMNVGDKLYKKIVELDYNFPLDKLAEANSSLKKKRILEAIPQEWIDDVRQMEIERISKLSYTY